jgi:hypothetical protein
MVLISCVRQIETTENYQDPNSFLISLLPDRSDLEGNWDVRAISSVQFPGDSNVDYTEIAKRYFVAFDRSEIHDTVLLQFEIRKMPTIPKTVADIPRTLPNDYELTEIKTDTEIVRYQGCDELASKDSNDCLFVLVKNSLVYSLEVVTKSNNPNIVESIERIAIPLVQKMENKLLSWDG